MKSYPPSDSESKLPPFPESMPLEVQLFFMRGEDKKLGSKLPARESIIDTFFHSNNKISIKFATNDSCLFILSKIFGLRIQFDINKLGDNDRCKGYLKSVTKEEHKELEKVFTPPVVAKAIQKIIGVSNNPPQDLATIIYDADHRKKLEAFSPHEHDPLYPEVLNNYSFEVGIEEELKNFISNSLRNKPESKRNKNKDDKNQDDKKEFYARLRRYYYPIELITNVPGIRRSDLPIRYKKLEGFKSEPQSIKNKFPAREYIMETFAGEHDSDEFKLAYCANDGDILILSKLFGLGKNIKEQSKRAPIDKLKKYRENITEKEHKRLKRLFNGSLIAIQKILGLDKEEGERLETEKSFIKREKDGEAHEFENYSFQAGIGGEVENFQTHNLDYKVDLFLPKNNDFLQRLTKYYTPYNITKVLFKMGTVQFLKGLERSNQEIANIKIRKQFIHKSRKIFRTHSFFRHQEQNASLKNDSALNQKSEHCSKGEDFQEDITLMQSLGKHALYVGDCTLSTALPVTDYPQELLEYTEEMLKICPEMFTENLNNLSLDTKLIELCESKNSNVPTEKRVKRHNKDYLMDNIDNDENISISSSKDILDLESFYKKSHANHLIEDLAAENNDDNDPINEFTRPFSK